MNNGLIFSSLTNGQIQSTIYPQNTVYQFLTADEICPAIGIENCGSGDGFGSPLP